MEKKKIKIGSNLLVLLAVVLIASIGTSIYSIKYIYDNKPILNDYPILESKVDSLSN